MNASNVRLVLSPVLLAIACGDGDGDAPKSTCDGSACTSGGSAGVGGAGAGGASGRGGAGGSSGRGGVGGSSGAQGTGAGGAGGTSTPDAGGRGGSPTGGSSGTSGSGGRPSIDGSPDFDAPPSDARDAAADAGRQCIEPPILRDAGVCTLAVCRRGATIEISATNSAGWYIGALFWVLTVCDQRFPETRGSGQALIYDVTEQEWARMREGDPAYMYYGTLSSSGTGYSCGSLTKNIQNCPP
jgi:hypothetical protein